MIIVQYDREGISVSSEGHANFLPEGKDLVCASVTVLFYTLAENVDRLMMRYRGVGGSDLVEGSGGIWYNPVDNADADAAREVFDTVCVGFEMLAEKYPEFVSYEEI